MSIKKYLVERKQVKILKKKLPEILEKINKEQKILLSKDNVLSELKKGKLFGIAGTLEHEGYHISYKFTTGISKK